MRIFRCLFPFLVLAFAGFQFFFFEYRAASDGVGGHLGLGFFLFSLDETQRKSGDVFFAQGILDANALGLAGRGGFVDRGKSSGTRLEVSADSGAGSASVPVSARSQRGSPPEERRGALGVAGNPLGCDVTARGIGSSISSCGSGNSGSATGAMGAAEATGLLRYFASDSPGRMISSSALDLAGPTGREPVWGGDSLKPRGCGAGGVESARLLSALVVAAS